MSFDREALSRAIAAHGTVARVVVAATAGSVPREVGASMLVWPRGQSGTIGGGALEHEAARRALAGERGVARLPLGPALRQCCGGAVTLLTETWDAARLAGLGKDVVARAADGPEAMPLAVKRRLSEARAGGGPVAPELLDGWMIEPVTRADRPLWIWGAGHVGRALVAVLAPLPDFAVSWIDTAPGRFPEVIPEGVTQLVAAEPPRLVPHAPDNAEHLILTYSHEIDLALCHALLGHGFARAGLIGSESKWARFRSRLRQLGHGPAEISRIRCPIGQPELGKHPQAIAVGVAADLLSARIGDAAARTSA